MNKYEILFLLKEHAEIHDTKESLESLSEQLADFCYEQSESLSENNPLHVYKDNNSFYSGMIFINYKENSKNDIVFIKEKLKNIVGTYNKIRFCINFNNKLEDLRNYF